MEDLHKKWNHRWIIPKAIYRNSNIHGMGLFAIDKILKDEVVAIIGGIIVPVSETKEYWDIIGNFGVQISDDFFVVPSTIEEIKSGGAFNHSCNPNVGWSGEITAVAMRDIAIGEELVMDYGMYDSSRNSFICNCNAKHCRKIITCNDWKDEKLREMYIEYFAPYLKNKIMRL